MPPPRRTVQPTDPKPAAPDPNPEPPTVVLGLSAYAATALRTAVESYINGYGQENLPARDSAVLAGILNELPSSPATPKSARPPARRPPRRPKR